MTRTKLQLIKHHIWYVYRAILNDSKSIVTGIAGGFDTQQWKIIKKVLGAFLVLLAILGLVFHNTPPQPTRDRIVSFSYQQPIPLQSLTEPLTAVFTAKEPVSTSNVSFVAGNDYEWGNCVWGVANWLRVPAGLGNANTWDDNARSMGFYVSTVPQPGTVAQTDAGYYGHVALVTQVNGSEVLIREMNSLGLGVTDERWVPATAFKYIYF